MDVVKSPLHENVLPGGWNGWWVHCSGESDVDGESGMAFGRRRTQLRVMVGGGAPGPVCWSKYGIEIESGRPSIDLFEIIAIQYLYNKYRTKKGIVGGGLENAFRRGLLICCIPFQRAV